MRHILAIAMERRKIPWAHVFGNHDHDIDIDDILKTKIYEEYKAGCDVPDLADKYFLSVKSIQKIIRDQKPSDKSDQKENQEG